MTGQIVQRFVSNNQEVSKGQKLFQIDPAQYKLAVQKAEVGLATAKAEEASLYANLAAAKANANKAGADALNSEKNYSRTQTLFARKLVSESELDTARTRAQVAKDNHSAATKQVEALESKLGAKPGESNMVKSAQNALAIARLNLARTLVTAPSDGIVSNIQYDIGTEAAAGHPVLSFIPSDTLWVSADFRENLSPIFHQTPSHWLPSMHYRVKCFH